MLTCFFGFSIIKSLELGGEIAQHMYVIRTEIRHVIRLYIYMIWNRLKWVTSMSKKYFHFITSKQTGSPLEIQSTNTPNKTLLNSGRNSVDEHSKQSIIEQWYKQLLKHSCLAVYALSLCTVLLYIVTNKTLIIFK